MDLMKSVQPTHRKTWSTRKEALRRHQLSLTFPDISPQIHITRSHQRRHETFSVSCAPSENPITSHRSTSKPSTSASYLMHPFKTFCHMPPAHITMAPRKHLTKTASSKPSKNFGPTMRTPSVKSSSSLPCPAAPASAYRAPADSGPV